MQTSREGRNSVEYARRCMRFSLRRWTPKATEAGTSCPRHLNSPRRPEDQLINTLRYGRTDKTEKPKLWKKLAKWQDCKLRPNENPRIPSHTTYVQHKTTHRSNHATETHRQATKPLSKPSAKLALFSGDFPVYRTTSRHKQQYITRLTKAT